MPIIDLDESEVCLLLAALDSHLYWNVSAEEYRNNGYVSAPVSDDEEAREEALDVNALTRKLGEPYFDEAEEAEIRGES